MDACFLPTGKKGAEYPHFPDPAFAVIWRNWGLVEPSRIAKALDTDEENVRSWAARLGLDPQPSVSPLWRQRGFLTVIRNNWNLCDYDQILALLNMTDAELEFTLREDDFMWDKMGSLKPVVARPALKTAYPADVIARLDEIAAFVKKIDAPKENAFAFIGPYKQEYTGDVVIPQQEDRKSVV